MSEFHLRPMTPADLPAVCALHNRSEAHDGVRRVLMLEELAEELDDVTVVLATDTRVAEVAGEPAGYAYTLHMPGEVKQHRAYVFGEVDPRFRRCGIGTALMRFAIQRGSEQLRGDAPDLPRYLRTDTYDFIESAAHLFDSMGLRPVRWFDELLRPLTDLPAVGVIDGVRVLPWDDERFEEIRQVRNIAFIDHWGSTPLTPEFWAQHTRGHGARQDLSFIVVDDDDRVVAYCFNSRYPDDDEVLGRKDAWIDNLGTLPGWRGRGIASLLIAHSLAAFAADGLTHASIGVDSDSPTGAARLYRSLGFEPEQRSITYELEVV